jgi:hypothetical protein
MICSTQCKVAPIPLAMRLPADQSDVESLLKRESRDDVSLGTATLLRKAVRTIARKF